MFYLTAYSTHFMYGHMVKDHSNSYFFQLAARVFYVHHPTDKITHTSRGALVGAKNSSSE